jgi:hypothetical protein
MKFLLSRWYKLSNEYWLKCILLKPNKCDWVYEYSDRLYFIDVAVGKTKRVVNDHYNRTRRSPKSLYKKSSNYRGGLETFRVVLEFIEYVKEYLPKRSILRVEGADQKRIKVYSRLLRYGFEERKFNAPKCWFDELPYYELEVM